MTVGRHDVRSVIPLDDRFQRDQHIPGRTVFDNANSSTLLVNGTQSSSPIYFCYQSTGTLGGSGTVGDLLLAYGNQRLQGQPGAVPGPGILRSRVRGFA